MTLSVELKSDAVSKKLSGKMAKTLNHGVHLLVFFLFLTASGGIRLIDMNGSSKRLIDQPLPVAPRSVVAMATVKCTRVNPGLRLLPH